MNDLRIAIDGPGGVGKSTVARAVAAVIDAAYLNSGAYYRAATLAVLRAGVDPDDGAAAAGVVERAGLDFVNGRMCLDGHDVSQAIRSPEVTAAVSAVSAHPPVRTIVTGALRAWAAERDAVVAEGRDIGTVVFPGADVKVFLDARPEVRAARRSGDPEAARRTVDEIEADLARRDRIDSTRSAAPLRPASDAAVIDTSDLDIQAVVSRVLDLLPDPHPGGEDSG